MRPTVGVIASMALAANAVLIPPETSEASAGDDLAMESLGINPFKRSVSIECPGCPFAKREGDWLAWEEGAGDTYVLDFEVGAREDTLDIAGVQLYPPTFGHFSEPFYVTQAGRGGPAMDPVRLRVTAYEFHFNSAETVSEAGNELLPMTFAIRAIEGKYVNPPTLTINVLKDAAGRLMIAGFGTQEMTPEEEAQECALWPQICRLRSMLAAGIADVKKIGKDKLEQVKKFGKGCHKSHKMPLVGSLPPSSHEDLPSLSFEGGHHHHQGHHGHHGHHHKAHMQFRYAIARVFFPLLVGVLAGTFTWVFCMAIACLISMGRFTSRAAYTPLESQDHDDDEDSAPAYNEKEAYMPYEAPPVYKEAEEKEVVPTTPEQAV